MTAIPTAPPAGRMPTPDVPLFGGDWTLDQLAGVLNPECVNGLLTPDEILGLHAYLDKLRLAADGAYRQAQYGRKPV